MIASRTYCNDYDGIMNFFREIYGITKNQYCWLPHKWEYTHSMVNTLNVKKGWDDWTNYIRIWEEYGRIVAICHKESKHDVYLQVRPGYEKLYKEMISYAEKIIPSENENKLTIYTAKSKKLLTQTLVNMGYKKTKISNNFTIFNLKSDLSSDLHSDYRFVDAVGIKSPLTRYRALNSGLEANAIRPDLVCKSFLALESSPLFRPDLEIMTEFKDKTITSFCLAWYDEETNIGMLNSLYVNINHIDNKLENSMIYEGLRKLKEIGANYAYINSSDLISKKILIESGFKTHEVEWAYTKSM